jgi:hypothetical protein
VGIVAAALLAACGGGGLTRGVGGAPGTDAAAGAGGVPGAAGSAGSISGGGANGSGGIVAAADAGADRSPAIADAAGDGNCTARTVALSALAPDVLILLDRSGSMTNDSNDQICTGACVGGSKWVQAGDATNQVVAQTESQIRWGIKFFPDNATCGITAGVQVVPQPGAAGAVATAIARVAPSGNTPTRTAIQSAATALGALTEANPKFIVLVTDGQPNCIPATIPTTTSDEAGTIQAVSTVADMGIPTFVVGVGALAVADATLSQMALAGRRPRDTVNPPFYYPVSDTGGLVTALRTIASAAISCTFALPVALADPTRATVTTAAGVLIPADASNGWTYGVSDQSIVLTGDWCALVRAGTLNAIQVTIAC